MEKLAAGDQSRAPIRYSHGWDKLFTVGPTRACGTGGTHTCVWDRVESIRADGALTNYTTHTLIELSPISSLTTGTSLFAPPQPNLSNETTQGSREDEVEEDDEEGGGGLIPY